MTAISALFSFSVKLSTQLLVATIYVKEINVFPKKEKS